MKTRMFIACSISLVCCLACILLRGSPQLPYPELTLNEQTHVLTVQYLATGSAGAITFDLYQEGDGKEIRVGQKELRTTRGERVHVDFPISELTNCIYRAEVHEGSATAIEVMNLYRSRDRAPEKARFVSQLLGTPLAAMGGFLDKVSSVLLSPTGSNMVYRTGLKKPQPQILFSAPDCEVKLLRPAPDGRSIAFVCSPDRGRPSEIWIFQTASSELRRLVSGRSPIWNRDGSAIYFLDGAELKRLRTSDNSIIAIPCDAAVSMPELLGFARDQSGLFLASSKLGSELSRIWAISPETGHWQSLSYDVAFLWLPYLSPDGTSFLTTRYAGFGSKTSIVVQTLDGGQTVLTDGLYNDQSPVWSADGMSVFFLSDRADTQNPGRNHVQPRHGASGGVQHSNQ
jgi:WD40 repeat protein